MDFDDCLRPLEKALGRAAKAHIEALRRAEEATAKRAEITATLRRLGFSPDEVEIAAAAGSARELAAGLATRLSERVSSELKRLSRLGRAGHPGYDLNRHITVRRVMLWADGDAEQPQPGDRGRPAFRRRGRRSGSPAAAADDRNGTPATTRTGPFGRRLSSS